ncbi:MAG: hypothetical protein M1813_009630 [Trichoglossum hirsutum]|nr:MAG: hypothetical protein M1813_009630 [Trichoglossum hirsutum]
MSQVPVIDSTPLFTSNSFSLESLATISQTHSAFSTWGICILTGTNSITLSLTNSLRTALNKSFSLPPQKKGELHLRNGGWAWRGYMPWGGEGTKGNTDQKEGFYGGPELSSEDAHPLKGMPTYEMNQFPDEDVPEMRNDAISAGLGLEKAEGEGVESCGIGEHSDFGFLTILSQNAAGPQVFSPSDEWVDVPLIPDSFVVNVGDILDRLTSGLYILHLPTPPCSTTIAYVRAAFHPILLSIPLGQLKSSPFRSPPSLAASSPIQRHRNAGNIGRCSIVSKVLGEYTLV